MSTSIKLMQEAIDSAGCATVCPHATATAECITEIADQLERLAKTTSLEPEMSAYFFGLHVGYRLRDLELSQPPSSDLDVN